MAVDDQWKKFSPSMAIYGCDMSVKGVIVTL